ncbi:CAAX geranylgeranyltransferase alpha subunit [Coemansia asiatica]|uniref:Protein farnesyltransferase/geranylgeranyltransferase type-1 subunit alpha n=1 Tax=Coemansia asiatica TaxID=1052880 RepID=A0A9W8CJJ7_9FUNG|nr:CAAX geranylgeranyltransferase alpha subunit [Coemansia asiatica]
MSSVSSEESSNIVEPYALPLSKQDEWKDVTPLEQEDGQFPICPIAYTDKYKEMMDYMRAAMAAGEVSERAYRLTSDVLKKNPGHYTVWVYRKKLIEELHLDIEDELAWLESIAEMYPKNYQSWHHREVIVCMLLDPQILADMPQDQRVCHSVIRRELSFLANVIDEDSKNFHAWSYRQWLVRRYGIWEQEKVFINTMIDQDVRNNSAWNQRYFVLVQGDTSGNASIDDGVLQAEIDYAVEVIKRAPNNESPWSYIVGMLLRHAPEKLYKELLSRIQQLSNDASYGQAAKSSPFYWSALVDIYESRAAKEDSDAREKTLDLARSACTALATDHDPTRMKYWEYRQTTLV